ncbi:MAG: helix-hairpin-helix domain-containing protein [Paenibacillaceae bacterium]
MLLFFVQYKKVIALSVIPLIAVVALIGYEVKHGQDNRSEPLAVNKEMQALLDREVKQAATPAPSEVNSPEASSSGASSNGGDELALEQDAIAKPKKTAKPQATSKPKSTSKSKAVTRAKTNQNVNFKVNVNKAMTVELMKLSGIGESKAEAIIAYRDAHSFQTLEELMKVKGIGPKIFAKIKDHLEL